jgi:hypothetical protein
VRLLLERAKQEYPVHLTERDIAIFSVLASGVQGLTTEQIKRLFFPGNWSTCTKRLQKLFQNRYIWRYKIDLHKLGFTEGPQETLIHTLDEAGARVLDQQLEIPVEAIWQPSDKKISEQDLRHLILNNDIRISIRLAVESLGYTVENWETDQTIRRKPTEQKWVVDFVPSYGTKVESGEIVPDDYLTIVTPERRYISILEIDTGTETRQPQQQPKGKDTSIATKVRRYIALFHKKDRSEPSVFEKITGQEQKGRVFFITTGGEDAVENLLNTIKGVGGKNTYWVGRYELARREDLVLTHSIWRKCGDTEPAYYSFGMSKLEQVRHLLKQYGVVASDIEACVTLITDLAKTQLLDGVDEWSVRKRGMSLDQAVALRVDLLAAEVLSRLGEQLGGRADEAGE